MADYIKQIEEISFSRNCKMCHIGADKKFKACKGMATYVDKKLKKRIKDYNYVNERVMTMTFKYERCFDSWRDSGIQER